MRHPERGARACGEAAAGWGGGPEAGTATSSQSSLLTSAGGEQAVGVPAGPGGSGRVLPSRIVRRPQHLVGSVPPARLAPCPRVAEPGCVACSRPPCPVLCASGLGAQAIITCASVALLPLPPPNRWV